MAHPLLEARLCEICGALLTLPGRDAEAIFGWPDVLKRRSCLTLFAVACPQELLFSQLLAEFYGGESDPRTLEILGLTA